MKRTLSMLVVLALFGFATGAGAADIIKANNTTALVTGGSFTTNPILNDGSEVAVWDNTVTAANTVAMGGDLNLVGIRIANPGGAVVVTHAAGNVLTIGSSGIDLSTATQNLTLMNSANVAGDIAINAGQTWNVASGRTLQLWSNSNTANQRLTGSANIEITGGGIVRVLTGDAGSTTTTAGNGNDTFSGNWTITSGSLRGLRNGTHAWGQGTLYLNGGTIGQEQGGWMWSNNIVLNTSTTSTFDDYNTSGTTRTLKLMGVISGDGNVNFNDSSSRSGNDTGYILTGSNSLSGTVTLGTGADVRVGGVSTANDLTLTSGTGGTLGTASVNLSSATSVLTISRSDNYTFANTVSGSGVLRIGVTASAQNTGITTVSGNNSHGGGTRIQSAATLNFGHVNAAGTGAIIISGNGSFDNGTGSPLTVANALEMSGGSPTFVGTSNMTINGAVTISGANRTITVTANTLTLGGNIGQDASARNLTKAGNGTLILSGTSAYTGATTISAGTLISNNADAMSSSSGVTVNDATLKLNVGATIKSLAGNTASFLDLNSQTLTVNGTSGTTYSGKISSTGGLVLRGGTLTIANSDGSAGTTGNFQLLSLATANMPAAPIALDTGASAADRKDFGFLNDSNDVLTLSSLTGYGAIRNDGGGTAGSTVIRFITVDQSGGDSVFNGALLSHRSTAIPSNAIRELTFEKKGTSALTLAGFIGKQTASAGSGAAAVNLIANGGILDVTNTANTTTTNTDAINLGTVTITSGTLGFANQALINTAGTAGATSISMNGGTLRWNTGNTQDITAGARLTLVDTKTATFDTNGNDVTLATALGGGAIGAAVTKTGTGKLTLTGSNSYTGATTVSQGTLALSGSGSIAGSLAIDVASGATLDVSALSGWTLGASQTLKGNGTVAGNATINGTVAPGNSIGTLTINDDLVFAGTYEIELGAANGTAGTDNDYITGVNNLTINGGALSLFGVAGFGTPVLGDKWLILSYTGTPTFNSAPSFTVDPSAALSSGWSYGLDTTTAGSVYLTVIPEPGTAGIVATFIAAALLRKRRLG